MPTIHLVSHTHWDREWYLTFQQFRLKLIHLVDGLLDILQNDPEYRYFLLDGQAIILEDYLQIRPDRRNDIERFVHEGRLLIGPWYISPDEFLVSPESHIRNLLEGQRICATFGSKMLVGYLPDTFGHIGQMPQILRGFGIDNACVWRGLDDQPIELIWESQDGSKVLLSNLRDSYSNAANLSTNLPKRFITEILDRSHSLVPFSSTGQLLLMHGTDHMEPVKDLPRAVQIFQKERPDEDLVQSNLTRYFEAVHAHIDSNHLEVPVVTGELRSPRKTPLLPGVMSTRITLKQHNSECETELLKWVEPFSVWTHLFDPSPSASTQVNDQPQPEFILDQTAIIRQAWKLLMQCHPHDSICGTSIDQVVTEMQVRFEQVSQISHVLIDQNLREIGDHIDTRFPGEAPESESPHGIISSIVVFNPNDQPQTGLLSLNVQLDERYSSIQIIDSRHESIPFSQHGMGPRELIASSMDRNELKQALRMVHEGNIAGMVIRDFAIRNEGNKANIRVTISEHGVVDMAKWKEGLTKLDILFADDRIEEYIVRAYSDPEVGISFIPCQVPGHGYHCYWICGLDEAPKESGGPHKLNPFTKLLLPATQLLSKFPALIRYFPGNKSKSLSQPTRIENEFFIVDAKSPNGTLSITDKRTRQIYPGLHNFVDGGDCGDLYNYCPPPKNRFIQARSTSIICENTSIRSNLKIITELLLPSSLTTDRKSRTRKRLRHQVTSIITLVKGVPRVDIRTELDNRSFDHRLRVHFPAPFTCSEAYHDGHFELVKRSIGIPASDDTWAEQPRPEVPQRYFSLVNNSQLSLTIANRGLPEVEVFKNDAGNAEISLTLLRCVDWLSRDDMTTRKGHAGPMGISTPSAQMLGHHSFEYSIIPGNGDILPSIQQAITFNAPLKAISEPIHSGALPSEQSLVENNNPNFLITSIKSSEDGLSLVIRGYNILAAMIDVTLKTRLVFHHAYLANLQEEIFESLPLTSDGKVNLKVAGKKIVTLILRL
jgi:mannosylglycerate hydrolase